MSTWTADSGGATQPRPSRSSQRSERAARPEASTTRSAWSRSSPARRTPVTVTAALRAPRPASIFDMAVPQRHVRQPGDPGADVMFEHRARAERARMGMVGVPQTQAHPHSLEPAELRAAERQGAVGEQFPPESWEPGLEPLLPREQQGVRVARLRNAPAEGRLPRTLVVVDHEHLAEALGQ